MTTDVGSIIGNAFSSITQSITRFFTGIINALLVPIKTVLASFGVAVGDTGIIAPIVLVLVLAVSVYLIWFFWWAKGFLPQS